MGDTVNELNQQGQRRVEILGAHHLTVDLKSPTLPATRWMTCFGKLVGLLLTASILAILTGCATERVGGRVVDVTNMVLPPKVSDRSGWAEDIAASFAALSIPAEPRKVCAVAAIIEQESGWQVDPVIPGLPNIARRELEKRLERHKVPASVLEPLLLIKSPNGQTYGERLARVRTEHELSRIYEDMIGIIPLGIGGLLFGGMNPVRTGGPMQVNINFAARVMRERPYPWSNAGSAREEVFTRRGGVYFGTAMLLDYPVSYDRMLYRFADYNAGRYASRNAAFQHLVAALSGRTLDFDGDLGNQTQAALEHISGLGMERVSIERDLRLEKSFDFERTDLYALVHALAKQRGIPIAVATLPDITLESPKITRKLSTKWFADQVEKRYRQCLSGNDSGQKTGYGN
jgi:hypothetical protein